MADIKSAWEIAQEKLAKIEEATPEERLRWKYIPEGERLAARFLKEDINLTAEINQYPDENARKCISQGVEDVLIRNIHLPSSDAVKKTNKRVMDTIKSLKSEKVAVENVFSQMRRLFNHYVTTGEEQRKQSYEELKMDIVAKLQQAIREQTGTAANYRIDVERRPEFQSEWRKLSSQLDSQYQTHLTEYREALLVID